MKTTRKATALAAYSALACLLCIGLTGCPGISSQVLPFFLDEPADSGDPLEATFLGSVTVTPPLVLESAKFRDPAGGPRPGESGFNIWPPARVRVMQWLWDFGDDTTGQGQVVDHLYAVPGCYTVTLTVILSNGMQGVYSREVCFASGENNPPVAVPDAPASAPAGSDVQLDGQASYDPDDDDITFLWTIVSAPEGSTATLDDPTSPTPKLLGPIAGTYVLSLQVNDGELDSTVVEVTVVIEEPVNNPPVAVPTGPESVPFEVPFSLDGTGSYDPDNDPITYLWAIVSAPPQSAVYMDDTTSATPQVFPDLPGTYVFSLVVNDGELDSTTEQVTVVVGQPSLQPIANAGEDFGVCQWEQVPLDGTGSYDPDGDPLTYAWMLVSAPQGSTAELDDPASPTPTFVPNVPGEYVFELVVDDGYGVPVKTASVADSVTITAETPVLVMADIQGNEFYFGPNDEEIEEEVVGPGELPRTYGWVSDFSLSETEVTNCMFAHVLNYVNELGALSSSPVEYEELPNKAGQYSGGDVYLWTKMLIRIQVEGDTCDIRYDAAKDHFYVSSREGRRMGRHPVNHVTWYGATAFCVFLDMMEGINPSFYRIYDDSWDIIGHLYSGYPGYRLPFEIEWEYAAAWDASNPVEPHWRYAFDNPTLTMEWANYNLFNPFGFADWPFSTPVAYFNGLNQDTELAQSPHGLFDMTGNVAEWVNDEPWDYSDYRLPGKQLNGLLTRGVRGGSWRDMDPNDLRTARRQWMAPDDDQPWLGFRIAQSTYYAVY